MPETAKPSSTIAGVSAGTGLVGFANLVSDPFWKQVLIYLSPTATMTVRYVWIFLSYWMGDFITKKTLDNGVKRMRALRDKVCSNPSSTQEHKKAISKQCEEIEILSAEFIAAGVRAVQGKLASEDNP